MIKIFEQHPLHLYHGANLEKDSGAKWPIFTVSAAMTRNVGAGATWVLPNVGSKVQITTTNAFEFTHRTAAGVVKNTFKVFADLSVYKIIAILIYDYINTDTLEVRNIGSAAADFYINICSNFIL